MALTQRLEIRQSQSLVMTPQLQQAIKLLQLSNLELSSFVTDQLENNPLLEIDDKNDGPAQSEADGNANVDQGAENSGDDFQESEHATETDKAIGSEAPNINAEAALDTDYANIYPDESAADTQNRKADDGPSLSIDWSTAGSGATSFDGLESSIEATLAAKTTLRTHLTEQLNVSIQDAGARIIGVNLIDNLDDAGYLTCSLESVADRLGANLDQVDEVFAVLQTFDPVGIFCKDLAECLTLQLKERDRFDPAMQALIENLDLLAKRDFAALKKVCGIDDEDLADMISEVRELDPKPGLAFNNEITQPVVPDVFVRPAADGGWKIELNSDTLPRVLVNQVYYAEVNKSTNSREEKAFLSECYNNANWLVKSLDQRAKTILKVSKELVKQQDGFLVHGVQHLKPLNLKVIAEAISMHESTVSRVTANKYIATPQGLYELKYFFTSAIASSQGGEAHSAEAVRHKIRELIDAEHPSKILSDDRIVEILRGMGVEIARRTIAKYREAMKIPSSVQRRRLKKQLT